MRRKKIGRNLLFGYLGVMVLPLVVATWYTSTTHRKLYVDQIIASEKKNAYLVRGDIGPLLAANDYAGIDSLCKRFGREIGMRITVVRPSGRVIGDSERNPDSMENHRYRPEIIDALNSGLGSSVRFSTTLRQKMMYVATPVQDNGSIVAIVRTAVPLESVSTAINAFYGRILLIAVVMALLASLLSWILARRMVLPIRNLKNGAERFAAGELSEKLELPDIDELHLLAAALNEMAHQLDSRIKTITAQRNEQEAILASMSEGVIAIDETGRILSVNAAAAELFGIEGKNLSGRLLGEAVRNSMFLQFAQTTLDSEKASEEDITVPPVKEEGRSGRILQIKGSALRDSGDRCVGAVLVASDVTRLRRLETMRKEFVANVSHELRTPLTTIKGFVETLLSGALDSREEAVRFLTIIEGQAERLTSLVEDLLTLAIIEREEETRAPIMEVRSILDVANAAARNHLVQAQAKLITITVSGDGVIAGPVNGPLLEQAIGNLIDNAIKYSDSGSDVAVNVSLVQDECVIAVIDQGIGIAPEHLDRLFERFYRVDKARSRTMGGTGLGLSIVKHIAGLHSGRCSVESRPGKGSTFRIMLPALQSKKE